MQICVHQSLVARDLTLLSSSTCLVREQGATLRCCVSLALNQELGAGYTLAKDSAHGTLLADFVQHNSACTSKRQTECCVTSCNWKS